MSVILREVHDKAVQKWKRRTLYSHLFWILLVGLSLIRPYALQVEIKLLREAYGIVKGEFGAVMAKQELLTLLRSKNLTIGQGLDIADAVLSQSEVPVSIVLGVISQESNFRPGAVSEKGARGLMQILKPTYVAYAPGAMRDQIHNPVSNIKAGVAYLGELRRTYGTWRKALRSYYAGPQGAGNQGYDWYASSVLTRAARWERQMEE